MLERVWKIGNPLTLLVGMQMYTTTMEKSMDIPLKLGIKLPYDPAIPLLGIYPEETRIENDRCTPMFIAAIFTIARTWKKHKCPSTDEWIKKMWCIYNAILLSRKKEQNWVICSDMDEPRVCHTE